MAAAATAPPTLIVRSSNATSCPPWCRPQVIGTGGGATGSPGCRTHTTALIPAAAIAAYAGVDGCPVTYQDSLTMRAPLYATNARQLIVGNGFIPPRLRGLRLCACHTLGEGHGIAMCPFPLVAALHRTVVCPKGFPGRAA